MKIRSGTSVCPLSIAVSVVLYRIDSNQVRNGGNCAEFSSDLFTDFCNNANNDRRHTADNSPTRNQHFLCITFYSFKIFNPLNAELNPICYLLALLAHHFLHVSRIRVTSLTLRLLMSYIYGAPILDVSRSHTTTQHSR